MNQTRCLKNAMNMVDNSGGGQQGVVKVLKNDVDD